MIEQLELTHPFYKVYDFLESKKGNLFLEMSRYVYIPDQVNDERQIFKVPFEEFNTEFILQQINSLQKNQELAFHSTIFFNGKKYHLGFIDFLIHLNDFNFEKHYFRLKQILPKKIMNNLQLYSSGNSLHGYSLILLEPKEWRQFMARLLLVDLLNSTNKLIDTRWVGHRFLSDFGSLRWSNNSGTYKALPTLISTINYQSS